MSDLLSSGIMIGLSRQGAALAAVRSFGSGREQALTISLIVFVALFAIAAGLLLALVFSQRFRRIMLGNRAVRALDERRTAEKADKQAKNAIADAAAGTEKDVPFWIVREVPLPEPEEGASAPPVKPAARIVPTARAAKPTDKRTEK